ncbi:MAG: ABC transporter permease [Lysobacterales bacterium]
MNQALWIASEEWRYWSRSRLAAAVAVVMLALTVASALVTWRDIAKERSARVELQAAAESTFAGQPDRHPHRMVHYGHYVFRTPPPLALIDPGVDQFTGAAVFLEGHRQNSATFSPAYSGPHGGSFANLSPATVYQVLVPLMIIVAGFASVAREREGQTELLLLTVPVSRRQIWFGKTLALASLVGIALLPLVIALALAPGDLVAGLTLLGGYAVYLMIWACLVVSVSDRSRASSSSLIALLALWLVVCIAVPRLAATSAQALVPMPSKIESDLAMTIAMRNLGDGHNAADPAFERLRANLLVKHGVDHVEDLPVNIRGVVAEASEAEQSKLMDEFAQVYAQQESRQSRALRWSSIASPMLAIQAFSTSIAGTDLAHRHKFLRQAEQARFEFVQDLNRLHQTEMTYEDDMRRSSDADSERRTRLSAANWSRLKAFELEADTLNERWARGAPFFLLLLVFLLAAAAPGLLSRRGGEVS